MGSRPKVNNIDITPESSFVPQGAFHKLKASHIYKAGNGLVGHSALRIASYLPERRVTILTALALLNYLMIQVHSFAAKGGPIASVFRGKTPTAFAALMLFRRQIELFWQ